MGCDLWAAEDGTPIFLCGRGIRESRKRCAFCRERATALCDGDRCTHPICDAHRWAAAPELDFCPPCEVKVLAAARLPKQESLFA